MKYKNLSRLSIRLLLIVSLLLSHGVAADVVFCVQPDGSLLPESSLRCQCTCQTEEQSHISDKSPKKHIENNHFDIHLDTCDYAVPVRKWVKSDTNETSLTQTLLTGQLGPVSKTNHLVCKSVNSFHNPSLSFLASTILLI